MILGTFGHFFFDHDHDKNGPGRSALLWCVFGLAPPYNWQVDIFPFSCETPDKCQKCEASREYWETMICDIFWNWVIGKVKMYSGSLLYNHQTSKDQRLEHSWNRAVWKPKGFTRENCFQQISRASLSSSILNTCLGSSVAQPAPSLWQISFPPSISGSRVTPLLDFDPWVGLPRPLLEQFYIQFFEPFNNWTLASILSCQLLRSSGGYGSSINKDCTSKPPWAIQ